MTQESSPARSWRIGPGKELTLDQPRIMGILNVTPDSFSDGGAFISNVDAIDHGVQLAIDGACIIDVGGESTRPGARSVPPAEQIRRVIPVIRGLAHRLNIECGRRGPATRVDGQVQVYLSIDTTNATVAEAALKSGATIINDVSAGRGDAKMLPLAAARRCGLILMHRLLSPQEDSFSDQYPKAPDYAPNVVAAVREFLCQRVQAALAAGVDPASIVIDPGLGFGKSVEQNYELVGRIGELCALGYPVLSAASRKSFIGAATGVQRPAARVAGSTAVSVMHWLGGVRLFRVHDVSAHREALAVAVMARDGTTDERR
jgi:dihydropteroate synthase